MVLSVQNVSKSFGKLRAVDDLSFEAHPGRIFGLLGANGAGKTTTIRMILGIVSPDAGRITWRGQPVDRAVQRRIGYLPEELSLDEEMKIEEVLVYLGELKGLSGRDAKVRAREWLERFGLGAMRKQKIGVLSKGNQQKVQFIAAVLHDPVSHRSLEVSDGGNSQENLRIASGITTLFVLFFYIIIGEGLFSLVAEITKEKSSRFIELVIPSVSPIGFMFAKIIGYLGFFIIQYIAIGLILFIMKRMGTVNIFEEEIDISKIPIELVLYAALLFILGYLFYATIGAVVGSMASRVEDSAVAVSIVMLPFFFALLITTPAFAMPDAALVRVLSWVPPFTPLLLFVRIALGDISWWEIVGEVGLLGLSTIVLLFVAARIFRRTILNYEGVSWGRFWSLLMDRE